MEIKFHNKLVRDGILMKLAQNGIDYTATTLKGQQHYKALEDKLLEETGEVLRAPTRKDLLGELADVIEVCCAMARKVGYSDYDLELARVHKKTERGSFDNGDFLVSTKNGGANG
jgi:predicted house-cleaning noncanonical NTP pyrophosphatase (MazG superfamily)